MAMQDCIQSPIKNCQEDLDLLSFAWQQQGLYSNDPDATTTLPSDDLLLNSYDFPHEFEDWSHLDGFEFTPSTPSNEPEFESESPISSGSSINTDDPPYSTEIDPSAIFGDHYTKNSDACKSPSIAFPDIRSRKSFSPGSNQSIAEDYVLSPTEIQKLFAIAMPSPSSSRASRSPTSSPTPELEVDSPPQKKSKHHPQRVSKPKGKPCLSKNQREHNIIEKRYRNNLNSKITTLRDCVPCLRNAKDGAEGALGEEIVPQKINKATILSKAIEYISQLEKKNEKLAQKVASLEAKTSPMEGLIRSRQWESIPRY